MYALHSLQRTMGSFLNETVGTSSPYSLKIVRNEKVTYLRGISKRLDNDAKRNVAVLDELEVVENTFGGGAHQTSVTVEKSVINHWFLPNVDWLGDNLLLLRHGLLSHSLLWSWRHLLLLGVSLLLSKLGLLLVSKLKHHCVSN